MNTKQIEIPSGSQVRFLISTPTENRELSGEFAGFVPVGQVMFVAIQNTTLENVTQLMIPLPLVSMMEFKVKLSALNL